LETARRRPRTTIVRRRRHTIVRRRPFRGPRARFAPQARPTVTPETGIPDTVVHPLPRPDTAATRTETHRAIAHRPHIAVRVRATAALRIVADRPPTVARHRLTAEATPLTVAADIVLQLLEADRMVAELPRITEAVPPAVTMVVVAVVVLPTVVAEAAVDTLPAAEAAAVITNQS